MAIGTPNPSNQKGVLQLVTVTGGWRCSRLEAQRAPESPEKRATIYDKQLSGVAVEVSRGKCSIEVHKVLESLNNVTIVESRGAPSISKAPRCSARTRTSVEG
jgi:hypothetical protein